MKKFLVPFILFFAVSLASFSQQNTTRTTKMYLAVDLNVPVGDFAKSEYQLSPGAENYYQEGTFNPALGVTLGLEIKLATDIVLRPTLGITSYKGKHDVGGFDKPKMELTDVRLGGDLIYYVSNTTKGSFYFTGTLGMDMEKLTVNRMLIFKETFDSRCVTAGVGIGYLFGPTKCFSMEAAIMKSIAGDKPCNESFPELNIFKISLGIKI